MVDYYDLNYDFSCNSLSDSIVNRYINIMKNRYVSHWNQTLQQSQKLSFYCFFFIVDLEKVVINLELKQVDTKTFLAMKGYVTFVQV